MFFKLLIQPTLETVTTLYKIYYSTSFPFDVYSSILFAFVHSKNIVQGVLFCLFCTKNLACNQRKSQPTPVLTVSLWSNRMRVGAQLSHFPFKYFTKSTQKAWEYTHSHVIIVKYSLLPADKNYNYFSVLLPFASRLSLLQVFSSKS